MAETNKSQMMSEAEIIEAINADSLISVSLEAGQPQKNVKMSTLASVAAGLMSIATIDNKGLQSALNYANSVVFQLSTGSPATDKLFRLADLGYGFIAKVEIIIAGQYTPISVVNLFCGDGKVQKQQLIGDSTYFKIYKDSSYAYVWISKSIGDYARCSCSFTTLRESKVKFADVTNDVNVSSLTQM